jgi:hypothetical protein
VFFCNQRKGKERKTCRTPPGKTPKQRFKLSFPGSFRLFFKNFISDLSRFLMTAQRMSLAVREMSLIPLVFDKNDN